MLSRPVLAAAMILGCGWVTTQAQQQEAPATVAVALAAPQDDQSTAPPIKLASADSERAAAAKIAAGAQPTAIDTPQGWVLMGAGAWLIVAVSRRRRRPLAH